MRPHMTATDARANALGDIEGRCKRTSGFGPVGDRNENDTHDVGIPQGVIVIMSRAL